MPETAKEGRESAAEKNREPVTKGELVVEDAEGRLVEPEPKLQRAVDGERLHCAL